MGTNGMVCIRKNGIEKGIFSKFSSGEPLEKVARSLCRFPVETLTEIYNQLAPGAGDYRLFFREGSLCEYAYVIDLDRTTFEVYDKYSEFRLKSDPYNCPLCLIKVEKAFFGIGNPNDKFSMVFLWDGYYKKFENIISEDVDTLMLFCEKSLDVGQWFVRNIFNSIYTDYYPVPSEIPSDWRVIINTNNETYKVIDIY